MKRYCPQIELPPYAHRPGTTPHPCTDPEGHLYGKQWEGVVDLNEVDFKDCPLYLYGFDLYNNQFYWEAHEVWETLWHKSDRSKTPCGQLLQALICLTGANLKKSMSEYEQCFNLLKRSNDHFKKCDELVCGLKIEDFSVLPEELHLEM